MSGPRIEVHIDELVLEGVSDVDPGEFTLALEQHLSRLVAEDGLRSGGPGAPSPARIDVLDAGSHHPDRPGPTALAAGVARTIWTCLGTDQVASG